MRILVVDDNEVNQLVLTRFLSKQAHSTVAVSNGQEALAALETQSFDLILMDYQMPLLNGVEASKMIRIKENRGQHIPILCVSACDCTRECSEAGMDGYISKPVNLRQALEIIGKVTAKLQKAAADV